MPNREEAKEVANFFFEKTGFPFVQGVVDGTHVEIAKPVGNLLTEFKEPCSKVFPYISFLSKITSNLFSALAAE